MRQQFQNKSIFSIVDMFFWNAYLILRAISKKVKTRPFLIRADNYFFKSVGAIKIWPYRTPTPLHSKIVSRAVHQISVNRKENVSRIYGAPAVLGNWVIYCTCICVLFVSQIVAIPAMHMFPLINRTMAVTHTSYKWINSITFAKYRPTTGCCACVSISIWRGSTVRVVTVA